MSKKPDLATAMLQLIDEVKNRFPLYEPDTYVCGIRNTDCQGCPKKLLEMVDSELCFWESAIRQGRAPRFDELRRFGKLCQSVERNLIRNQLIADT
ncbi:MULTISPECIES: hypothetical protein [Alkalimonas]|uniref:Uncharacterized protein n=1 Tax=Alkalimonas mucilaginosa TaxID=3057676 RepID=A0ABU7JEC5_9GAMM|nr:hypothetical protein [Alkalimonas sp. MEB004]MEE2023500.1 hypothetical protein [Alkalimonas sp. MEB004]